MSRGTLSRTPREYRLLLAVVCYAILNAVLYSSLLPLWEGFDEAFHYGYVQHLWVDRSVPALGQTTISNEIDLSLHLAPVSYIVRRTIPGASTFDEFFSLPRETQAERRAALFALCPGLARKPSQRDNYEAHQGPLAYALLAMPDWLWSARPLPVRVWRLRVLASCASVALVAVASILLAAVMSLGPFGAAILAFIIFSTQTYYATVCHVANDWLAVPLAFLLFAAAARLNRTPTRRLALATGLILGLGLVTKAYFLAFVPLICGLAALRLVRIPRMDRQAAAVLAASALLIAAPWYVRNLWLHGTISGTVEAASGLGPAEVIAAAPGVDWFGSVAYMARGSLWTGNNHFSTFSRGTLNLMLLLFAIGAAAYLAHLWRRGVPHEEQALLAGVLLYLVALAYVTAQSHVFRHGESAGASVWYTQVLSAPAACLFLRGLFSLGKFGRAVLTLALLLWTYVICATYLVKLIPLYGGYQGRANVGPLLDWYRSTFATDVNPLAFVALARPAAIYMMTALCVASSLGLCCALLISVWRYNGPATGRDQ